MPPCDSQDLACSTDLLLLLVIHYYLQLSNLCYVSVRIDPGKVWKVLEFNVEIFKALKIFENDHNYVNVWKNS